MRIVVYGAFRNVSDNNVVMNKRRGS